MYLIYRLCKILNQVNNYLYILHRVLYSELSKQICMVQIFKREYHSTRSVHVSYYLFSCQYIYRDEGSKI